MFTLSKIFLEDGENLFQDFWSSFSISFLYFSARGIIIKKVNRLTGPCPTRTLHPAGLFKAEARAAPAPNPSRPAASKSAPPPLEFAVAAAPQFRRPAADAAPPPRRHPATRHQSPPLSRFGR